MRRCAPLFSRRRRTAMETESSGSRRARRRFAALAAASLALASLGSASAQEALVTTDWVAQHTGDPKVRVVEVSVDPGVYEKGHVAGAVGLKWHSELCDPVSRDILS